MKEESASRAKIYEQLESSICELERTNSQLGRKHEVDKKRIQRYEMNKDTKWPSNTGLFSRYDMIISVYFEKDISTVHHHSHHVACNYLSCASCRAQCILHSSHPQI
jgi:hypothetical protein